MDNKDKETVFILFIAFVSMIGAMLIGYNIGINEGYKQSHIDFIDGMKEGYPDGESLKPLDMLRDFNHNVSEGGYLVGYMYGYPYHGNTTLGVHEHKLIIEFND